MGLRIGPDPRVVVTTTPRPTALIREIIADPNTVGTSGTTYESRGNLNPAFYQQIIRRYEGTRLGRQELNAEVLTDNPGALWKRSRIDELRVTQPPELVRIVVAVDPEAVSTEESAETGIVVVGMGEDGEGYVLADKSVRATPAGWSREVVAAYHLFKADLIVAEKNNGGEMVEHTLRTVPGAEYLPIEL